MHRWIRVIASLALLGLFAFPAAVAADDSSSTQSEGAITLSPGQCAIRMIASSEIDFGTFTWDGYAYVADEGAGSERVRYAVAPARNGCEMSIQTEGLFRVGSGEAAVISPVHFGVKAEMTEGGVPQWVQFDLSGSVSIPWSISTNRNNVTLGIVSMPNDIPPGEYKGSFTFTVSNAQ